MLQQPVKFSAVLTKIPIAQLLACIGVCTLREWIEIGGKNG
jgi:hypothetical protein